MVFLIPQKTIIAVVFAALTVLADQNNIFQGIERRPIRESVGLMDLIPSSVKAKNVNPAAEVFRETCDGNLSSCILTLNGAADELLRQVGAEVYTDLNDAMVEYTGLAFHLIKASVSEGRALETVDFVNFLSLKNAKGHCALAFLYRTDAYQEPLFDSYMLFSDLQNVFISSVDKPYDDEKLLQLLQRKTEKCPRVMNAGNYNGIVKRIKNSRQIIDDVSSPFCAISQSWFHPKYLKWKNLMYAKNGAPTFDPTVVKYATEKRKQALGVSALPPDWYDSIRSETDVNVLLEFNSQIVEGVTLTMADHGLRLLNYITMALDDLANSLRDGSINLPTDGRNRKRIDRMIESLLEYLNRMHIIFVSLSQRRGIEISSKETPVGIVITIYRNLIFQMSNVYEEPDPIAVIAHTVEYLKRKCPETCNRLNMNIDTPELIGSAWGSIHLTVSTFVGFMSDMNDIFN